MNIWIFQAGEPLHIDSNSPKPMRAMNLANALNQKGHSVIIWSSAFYHQEKKHRVKEYKKIKYNNLLEIRLIPSPGYFKNIGIKRLYDHAILGINLGYALKKEETKPDMAFIGYPPIEFAYVAQKWMKNRNVPTMLDIKDLWPEIFISAFPKNVKNLAKILLFPYFYLAKKVVNNATVISSMTNAFLNYTVSSFGRKISKDDIAFPFSTPKIEVSKDDLIATKKWWLSNGLDKNALLRISYVGNISSNSDITQIKEAALFFKKKIEFVICGDGPLLEYYKKKFEGIVNVKFPGRVNHLKASALYDLSHAMIIPYKNSKDFQLSLPNKFIDALSYGLPVISTLSGEVAKMINIHNIGISFGKSFNLTLIEALNTFLSRDLNEMVNNSKKIYNEKFIFEKVYQNLVDHLIKLKAKV